MYKLHSERGQVIVFIVIAIFVLFAFAALAVDGGRIFSERRRLQSTADATAYAAVSAVTRSKDPKAAALSQAEMNGVIDSLNSADENPGAVIDIIVNYPPLQGKYAGQEDYYEVIIRAQTQAAFSGIFEGDTTTIEAYAVSHVIKDRNYAGNAAVLALATSGNAIQVGQPPAAGGIEPTHVTLNSGDVYSNADGVKHLGDSTLTLANGNVKVAGIWSGAYNVSPEPLTGQDRYAVEDIVQPRCPVTQREFDPNEPYLAPGMYFDEIVMRSVIGADGQPEARTYNLDPGIYCLQRGWRIAHGSKINISGRDVLIVLLSGEIDLGGSGSITLQRASSVLDHKDGNQYGGMLIYVAPDLVGQSAPLPRAALLDAAGRRLLGLPLRSSAAQAMTKDVRLAGNGSTYAGTVYNPDHDCTVEGQPALTVDGAIICQNIRLRGQQIEIKFFPERNYRLSPQVELTE